MYRPDVLYHYCSLESAIAILRTKTLRMSSLFHMNDSLEHKWLFKKAIASIKRAIRYADDLTDPNEFDQTFPALLDLLTGDDDSEKENDDTETDDADELNVEYEENRDSLDEIYCACFTPEHDSLSQFRAYSDNGYGVALGFDSDAFGFILGESRSSKFKNIELRQICYDENQQEDRLHDAISTTVPLHRLPSGLMKEQHQVRYFNLWSVAAWCKNPAFVSESEWRMVYRPFLDDEADLESVSYKFDVCVRGKMLVPYYELPLPLEGKVCKAIKSIVLGPSVSKETERALRKYLEANLFHGVSFDRSKASFRPT